LIPAGACPALLENYDYDSVEVWVNEIKKRKPENKIYEASVYRYWLLRFFTFGSEEYKKADRNISTILGTSTRIFDLMDKRSSDEER
tara:strand:+ start:3019 stop:3279 length:261 start_codon:yes stop_codon:yes gene_type:complete